MKSTFADTATQVRTTESTVIGRLGASLSRYFAARRDRQGLRELLHFDDRQLADIGLTRGDVEWALGQPLSRDLSQDLALVRRGRSL